MPRRTKIVIVCAAVIIALYVFGPIGPCSDEEQPEEASLSLEKVGEEEGSSLSHKELTQEVEVEKGCPLSQEELKQLAEAEGTEEEWRRLWLKAEGGSELDRIAKQKLTESGYFTRQEAEIDAKHAEAERLAKKAETEGEWRKVWLKARDGTELSKMARKRKNELFDVRIEAEKKENNEKARELARKLINQ